MKLHPRTKTVRQAQYELHTCILDLEEKHDLTVIEIIGMLLEEASSMKKYALQVERHPGHPNKKADEA